MRKLHSSASWALSLAVIITMVSANQASAQLEVNLNTGIWLPLLPEYKALSIVDSGTSQPQLTNIFQDNQSEVGWQFGANSFYHFAPTRTMLESEFSIAGIGSMGSAARFDDPNATQSVWLAGLNGINRLASANGGGAVATLDSDVFNYNKYLGLRDRFSLERFGLGTLDIGAGFGIMEFRQDHQLDVLFDSNQRGQYLEDLNSTYIGGEVRATFTNWIGHRRVMLDLGFGVYDLDADYSGTSTFRGAGGAVIGTPETAIVGLQDIATTVDVGLRFDTMIAGICVRPSIDFKYISDMAAINHPQTETPAIPVSLSTDRAYVIGANLEFVF